MPQTHQCKSVLTWHCLTISGGFRLRPGRPRPTHSVDRPTHSKLRPTLTGTWSNLSAMRRKNVKNDIFVAIRCVLSSSKYTKTRFRPGLCPGPRWGSLRRSPDPLVGWGGDTLRRLDLGAFDASVVRPPTQIPGYAYDLPNFFLAYSWPKLSKKPGTAPADHNPKPNSRHCP